MRRYIVAGSLVVLVLIAVAWRFYQIGTSGAEKKGKRGIPVVSVLTTGLVNLEESFQAVGNVESPQRVELSPKVSGRVEYIMVHPGDYVRQNTVLIRLDGGQLQDEVNEAQAQVAEAKARLAQARLSQGPNDVLIASALRQQEAALTTAQAELEEVKHSSEASVAAAKAEVNNARAEAGNAQVKLSRVTELYRQAFTAAQDVDDARTQAVVANGKLTAAEENLHSAQAKATASVAVANAKLKQAQAGYDHAKASVVSTSAYQQNLSALEAVVEAAQAKLDSTKSSLGDTVLKSPLDGYVTERFLDQGSLAKAGEPIMTLQATQELWVNVAVPGVVRDRITESVPVTVQVEGGSAFASRILRINAAASPQDRQFQVRVLLPKACQGRPGMFARVTLTVEQHAGVLAVPVNAVRSRDGVDSVAVVGKENTIARRPVKLGFATADSVEIVQGLKVGEKVVCLGGADLEEGDIVRVDDGTEASEGARHK